mgnify:CR=1 FL=1
MEAMRLFSSVRDGRKPVPLCSDVRICAVADEDEGAVQQTSFFMSKNSEENEKNSRE